MCLAGIQNFYIALMWCWRNREDKMVRESTFEKVIEYIGEKRMILSDILRRKANWIGNILIGLKAYFPESYF